MLAMQGKATEHKLLRLTESSNMRAMLSTQVVIPALTAIGARPCFHLISLQHAYFKELQLQGVRHPQLQSLTVTKCFAHSSSSHCWQCGTQTTNPCLFFCDKCKVIQPPAEAPNLFGMMGLTQPVFDIDQRQLEARYKHLQRDLHPDKFGQKAAKEQEYSAEQSSLVNHAYTLLKSPLRRALHLLQSKGVAMPEDGGTVSDPELLMDVMEQREAVEDTNDVNVLHDMLAANQKSEQTTVQKLSEAFKANDLDRAQTLITDLRYVTRTGEAIASKLP